MSLEIDKFVHQEIPMEKETFETIIKILKSKKQIVLQGAPGTGKTFITAEIAVRICDGCIPDNREAVMTRYQELMKEGRIAFTTFHQSMDYEQFVEGFVPQIIQGKGKNVETKMVYSLRDGMFKEICESANPSFEKLFQILVSLIEEDKILNLVSESGKKYEHLKPMTTNEGDKAIYIANEEDDNFSDNPKNNDSKLIRWNRIERALKRSSNIQGAKEYLHKSRSGDASKQIAVLNKLVEMQNAVAKTNYVLIIDEINRGNISKILGELITLLEADKRDGETNCVTATLPYSNEKFSVPSNLYIIGTMNTADRSVGYIDYAVRRRFAFINVKADRKVIEGHYSDADLKKHVLEVYDKVDAHIKDHYSQEMKPDDVMIGHSYFLAKDREEFDFKLKYEIQPLLDEYFADGIITEKLDILNNNGRNISTGTPSN